MPGSKRMMQSDEGREELAQGSFDLDKTTDRVAKVGQQQRGWVGQLRGLGGAQGGQRRGWAGPPLSITQRAAGWGTGASAAGSWAGHACLHSLCLLLPPGAPCNLLTNQPTAALYPLSPIIWDKQEGAKEASPGAAARADDPDVKKAVKSRVVAGSQAS